MFERFFEELKSYREHKFDRKEFIARIKQLPTDYQIVYNGITHYLWSTAGGSTGIMLVLMNVLKMFEDGSKNDQNVLDVIGGDDVIGFCDTLLREASGKSWKEQMKVNENMKILDQLREETTHAKHD